MNNKPNRPGARAGAGSMGMRVLIERAYDTEHHDGTRILIDRIWPRGVKKEALKLDDWVKDVAPSNELRKWFDHDPERWEEFQKRYVEELEANEDGWQRLLRAQDENGGELVLIFGARDREHNNAVVLRDFLARKAGKSN